MTNEQLEQLIGQMTLEEKAGMLSGEDWWHTKAVERLGIPAIMMSDGPHGLRKQEEDPNNAGVGRAISAVCFPTGCSVASSFDRNLIYEMGSVIGRECRAVGVDMILGPAVNIKRSPLCGRNFEYFSEDPYLASHMAASLIKGVQDEGVGTCIKHFAANNQEYYRTTIDEEIDERTMREIYLSAFEYAIREAKPWSIMCSYNMVNGTHMSENKKYLTEILRDEWGYEGCVVSDWGAVNLRAKGVDAGLDLEMPSSNGTNDLEIVRAVKNGTLSEEAVDLAVKRVLQLVYRCIEGRSKGAGEAEVFDRELDHKRSAEMARECLILLKNEDMLPLSCTEKVAFIGRFAKNPRYQGGGSSHIDSAKVDSALQSAMDILGEGASRITYAKGYRTDQDEVETELIEEAVEAAKAADKAVIFCGLPDSFESEGYDRTHMRLPNCQNELIMQVLAVQPKTIIVLHNGSPVEMPWAGRAKAILENYLAGDGVGRATVEALYGVINPSGKLPESIPFRIENTPCYLNFPGENGKVSYREGIFVGYRYYDKKKMDVRYPFGFGLSYTTFEYSDLTFSETEVTPGKIRLEVKANITNTGSLAGKEAVQLYVGMEDPGNLIRPVRELKGFEKVSLQPGETKTVTFVLDDRSFAHYQVADRYGRKAGYKVTPGNYQISVAASSRDLRLNKTVKVLPEENPERIPYHLNSTFGEIMADPKAYAKAKPVIEKYAKESGLMDGDSMESMGASTRQMVENIMREMPLRQLVSFSGGYYTMDMVRELIDSLNEE